MHTLGDLEAAIEKGGLGEVIDGAIADVFAQLTKEQGSDTWMAAYLKSEQRRLRVRLEEWLANEAKRVPFTVEATEKVLDNVSVGGLKLRLRADRVDRVSDGKRLLLDYKSGEVATKDWEGMRPKIRSFRYMRSSGMWRTLPAFCSRRSTWRRRGWKAA